MGKRADDVHFQLFILVLFIVLGFFLGSVSSSLGTQNNFSVKFIDVKLLPNHDRSNTIEFTINERSSRLLENDIFKVKNVLKTKPDDQGQWGSCTAFQMKYAYLHWLAKHNKPIVEPSTSYWYAKSRIILNNTSLRDIGSTTNATVNVLRIFGTIDESLYKYSSFNIFNKTLPTNNLIFSSGIQNAISFSGDPIGFKLIPLVIKQQNIPLWQTQADLFCNEIDMGRSILISVLVYKNWMTENVFRSGIIPSPQSVCIGAHAICLSGYDKTKKIFTFYNSWGQSTGYVNNTPGLFSIPFSYAANSSIDKRVRAAVSSDWWSL